MSKKLGGGTSMTKGQQGKRLRRAKPQLVNGAKAEAELREAETRPLRAKALKAAQQAARRNSIVRTTTAGRPYDPQSVAENYAIGVRSGEIVAGRLVKLCVERYFQDLEKAEARGFYFDPAKAREACLFFAGSLKFTKGEMADKPFIPLEQIVSGDYELPISNFVPSPSQTFILWNVYGWMKKENDCRRFTQAYVSTGKKWGKSEFAAGITLKQGLMDDPPEPGARVVICATKREQAFDLTFRQATQMVLSSPALIDHAKVYQYSIESAGITKQPFSSIKAIGSNKNTSDGNDLSGAILDELHEWNKKKHRKFFGTIITSGGSRRQPLILMITTAGDDQSDVWNELEPQYINGLEAAVESDQHLADNRFVFIARLDAETACPCMNGGAMADLNCPNCKGIGLLPGDDIFDEKVWAKANPNYPATPTLAYLRERAADAKLSNELKQDFRRYNCNLKASSFNKALTREVWARCAGSLTDWAQAETIAGAIDVGERDDLCSVSFVARFALEETHPLYNKPVDESGSATPGLERGPGGLWQTKKPEPAEPSDYMAASSPQSKKVERYRFECFSVSFAPTEGKLPVTQEPYRGWVEAEQLRLMPGPVIDMATFQETVIRMGRQLRVKSFRADPRNALQLLQGLEKARFGAVEHIQQFYLYNEPIKEWLRVIRRGLFAYNPKDAGLLTWSVNNLVLKRNPRGELMPDRERSVDKIDPVVSLIMAFAEAYYAPARLKSGGPYGGGEGTGVWT